MKHDRFWTYLLVAAAFSFAISFTTTLLAAAERLDESVPKDFLAGFQGDQAAFERAMKVVEQTLAQNSKHAEAMVWHGAGTFYLCGHAYEAGDTAKGAELWNRGLKEMDDAVALEPENVSVRRTRGGILLGATRHPMMPPEMASPLLEKGVDDYEKVLSLLKGKFRSLDGGDQGELLIGLADGWDRRGNMAQAQSYYERILKELPNTEYEQKAKTWMEKRVADK